MTKKYELTNETMEFEGHILHRIRALKDFGDVKAGHLGGWIESEDNLSHECKCWVYDEAKVYENAHIQTDARVFGNAKVFEYAMVSGNAHVYGEAVLYGHAWVFGHAFVSGNAKIYDSAEVYGKANVYDNAKVYGYAEVFGNARVRGDAKVFDNAKVGGDEVVGGNTIVCKIDKEKRSTMTKREICERLLEIHNRLFHDDIEEIGKDIGALILDIAAPDEETTK